MLSTQKAPKKGVRLLLMVLGSILAALLLAVAVLVMIPLIEQVDTAPVAGSADWMGRSMCNSVFSQGVRPEVLASSLRTDSAILISALPSAETGSD